MARAMLRSSGMLVVAIAAWLDARAADPPDRARPAPAFDRDAAPRREPPRPPARQRPDDLLPAAPKESRRTALARVAVPAPRSPDVVPPRPEPSDAAIERRALDDGAAMADGLAASEGRRELYRVGVHDGMREGTGDPALGRRDYDEGLRLGRFDRAGRDYGALEGAAAADEAARSDATRQAESQFLDLEWKPVPSPRPPNATFDGEFPPTPDPGLEPLFAAFPPSRVGFAPRRMIDAFEDRRFTPWRLHECSGRGEFYSDDWQDPERAFRQWSSDSRRSSFFRALATPAQRSLYEAAFADGFVDRLARLFATVLDRAYAEGFEDGWRYGAFLRAEWSFRQGYAVGFDAGMLLAAEGAFERAYPAAYDRAYAESYREWMERARPSILSARLVDGNDDGIFQPGERVTTEYALANHGGTAGTFRLELAGAALAVPASVEVRLPARRRVERAPPLDATLVRDLLVPSRPTLALRLAGERLDLPLRVSFPMEYAGEVSSEGRTLEGTARVRLEVVNRSRLAQGSVVAILEGATSGEGPSRVPIGRVEPGAVATAELALSGVNPLDLLGGTLVVRTAIRVGDDIHDRKAVRFPERATRLDDPDLVAYLVRLGRDPDPDPKLVDGARRLLMQRLEVDWRTRTAERGNPYREDARDGGRRTAVGELVAAYGRERSALGGSVAWNGLDDEIAALAERLEGVHPALRRWMKKLAARLA